MCSRTFLLQKPEFSKINDDNTTLKSRSPESSHLKSEIHAKWQICYKKCLFSQFLLGKQDVYICLTLADVTYSVLL